MPDLLILFAKAPVPGKVKTRLIEAFGAAGAAALYEASLADVVERTSALPVERWIAFVPDDGAEDYFSAAFPGLARFAQEGADLGERLAAGFARAFASGAGRVLAIGADSPTLPPAWLGTALGTLATADVVLGPAEDGGYYLVGVRAEAWPRAVELFRGIPWSTERVLETTLAKASEAGVAVELGRTWYDLDRPEDVARAAADADPASRLAAALRGAAAGLRRATITERPEG